MKRKFRIYLVVSAIFLFAGGSAIAQESVRGLLSSAKIVVDLFDSLDYQIENVDFNILTTSQNGRSTTQILEADYSYFLMAGGDSEYIKRIKVELYENISGEWSFLERGSNPSEDMPNISMIEDFEPGKERSCMIKVTADEFSGDETSGRYLLIIGKSITSVTIKSTERVPISTNTKRLKSTVTGKAQQIDCTFLLKTDLTIEQYSGQKLQSIYTITDSSKGTDGLVFTVRDKAGDNYVIIVSDKYLYIYGSSGKKNTAIGWAYQIAH